MATRTHTKITSVAVTGIWLRRQPDNLGGQIEVLAEVEGEWRRVIGPERDDGIISHIVEPAGIVQGEIIDFGLDRSERGQATPPAERSDS